MFSDSTFPIRSQHFVWQKDGSEGGDLIGLNYQHTNRQQNASLTMIARRSGHADAEEISQFDLCHVVGDILIMHEIAVGISLVIGAKAFGNVRLRMIGVSNGH